MHKNLILKEANNYIVMKILETTFCFGQNFLLIGKTCFLILHNVENLLGMVGIKKRNSMFGVIKEEKVLVGICHKDIMNIHVLLLVLDVYHMVRNTKPNVLNITKIRINLLNLMATYKLVVLMMTT